MSDDVIMNVLIRTCADTDKDGLKNLLNELGYSLNNNDISNNIKDVRNYGGEIFVAEYHSYVVGCICSIVDTRLAAGTYGELVSLVVSEERRGIGIGRELVKYAEVWLSERVTRIRVRVNTMRTEAHGFYNSFGYKDIKTQRIMTKNV